jgi:hypothetical protein
MLLKHWPVRMMAWLLWLSVLAKLRLQQTLAYSGGQVDH